MNVLNFIFSIFLNKFLSSCNQDSLGSCLDLSNWLLAMDASQSLNIDISGLENLVVLDWVKCLGEMLVWWTMILLERSVSD